MIGSATERDERTVSVENVSYRYAYLFLSYGLLISTGYRAFVRDEPSWDLIGLVIVGGAIAALYQGRQRVLSRRWAVLTARATVGAAGVAALIVLVLVALR
jgi:hypothetical protein